ncbi:HAMP domain-containing histidine kinase, partial [candidate division WOR-3 bacterium]|nr:HAMP domain-containing histidine kinase [candidate division WOR-3 bacterium]
FDDNISIENRVSDTIKIKADQALLRSVLLNLGTNSLKAMRNGGQLIFNCHIDEKVVIGVEDTGCGIPEKDIKRIFSPFYSRFNDGFGFGLAIVKKIIELHGWDCKVDSQLNKGTKFRIII